jgi:N-formylglutamate deformylase
MTDSLFSLRRRESPLIISIPHLGTRIPTDLHQQYTPQALTLADTDWHLDRLYEFATALEATVIQGTISRYVIDLNRPATGESLYPGMITTSLCPTETFRGEPIYRDGLAPHEGEVARRTEAYWRPYHNALKGEIARLRAVHPHVLLWEAHSIASVLPRMFAGKLPDLNFGTSDGQACDETVIASAIAFARRSELSWVLNGRYKGGFITRRYGAPASGIHAIQLEMCQSLYMDETAPFEWRADLAEHVAPTVRACVEGALDSLALLAAPAEKEALDILHR